MGTICAPAYANIFMDHFHGPFWKKIYLPILRRTPQAHLKFIDDIFFIWTGSKDQLITLSNYLNTSTIPSSLNTRYHNQVSLFRQGSLQQTTTNYTQRFTGKEQTDKNLFHINLKFSISLKNSIPYSQDLRVKRACSTIKNFKLYYSELKQKFNEINTYQLTKN